MAKRRANGEGSIYQRKDGTWTAQYTDCNGKKRYLYGKTQQIVKEKLKEAIRQSDTGLVVEPKRITISDWVKEWLEVYQKPSLKGNIYSNNLKLWRLHIAPYFNKLQLKDVKAEHIQRFVNEKSAKRQDGKEGGYSTSMVRQLYGLIYGALKKAVTLGYIPRNPSEGVKVKSFERKEKVIFTPEEQRRFEKCVRENMEGSHNATVFLLLLYTGLRIGEALGLRVSDIDLQGRELHVNRTVGCVQNENGHGVHFYVNSPKTKAGNRTIPMSDTVFRLMAGQLNCRNQLIEKMYPIWKAAGKDTSMVEAGYIYLTTGGNNLLRSDVARKLKKMLIKAGIPSSVTLHGLRHTFATRWLEAGLDVRSLAEILGHEDVKMTLNTYTHSLPEQRRKGMDAMGAWLAEGAENGA